MSPGLDGIGSGPFLAVFWFLLDALLLADLLFFLDFLLGNRLNESFGDVFSLLDPNLEPGHSLEVLLRELLNKSPKSNDFEDRVFN